MEDIVAGEAEAEAEVKMAWEEIAREVAVGEFVERQDYLRVVR